MVSYVAGFLFSSEHVLLVRKEQPSWQKGMLNGIGGKQELKETPIAAMIREFYEETKTEIIDWRQFCTEIGRGYVVHFFTANIESAPEVPWQNDVGESLGWYWVPSLNRTMVIGNLQWLIPLAQDPRGLLRHVVVEPVLDIKEQPTW